jgi:nucleoside-diphosphate-sugar epimerase
MTTEPRRVLVLGASGQIGLGLVAGLLARGDTVSALRRSLPAGADAARWLSADLTRDALPLHGDGVDAAIHATGLWLLPAHLEELAAAGCRRLVAFGSTSVATKAASRSTHERGQVAALADAEAAIAEHCARLGIAWTLFRPTLVYGRGRDLNISAAARLIERFGVFPLAGSAQGLRQPVHADDLAAVAIRALDFPVAENRAYDLAGGETLAYAEMIGRLFDAQGKPRRRVSLPTPLLAGLAAALGRLSGQPAYTAELARRMNRDLTVDDSDARRDLGWAPRGFLGPL